MDHAALEYPVDAKALEQGDTIYMTVADSAGNMVSLTQPLGAWFGSGVVGAGVAVAAELAAAPPVEVTVTGMVTGVTTTSARLLRLTSVA